MFGLVTYILEYEHDRWLRCSLFFRSTSCQLKRWRIWLICALLVSSIDIAQGIQSSFIAFIVSFRPIPER